MSRKCDGLSLPDYFNGPIHRPNAHCTGYETGAEFLWDMMGGCWPTTAEWLAWVRRRDGRKTLFGRHGWQYPIRPIIAAHRVLWTTQKRRRLP